MLKEVLSSERQKMMVDGNVHVAKRKRTGEIISG
jgi:hypothetical protein